VNLASAPTQIQLPFGNGDSSKTNPIPVASQIPITPGAASFTDGFPPLNATPVTDGGIPPAKADMNGLLFMSTAIDRWMSAGGGFPWSSAFSTAIGGYPKGARVLRATGNGYWLSTADNNSTDPDTGGAGWIPDRAVSSVVPSAQRSIAIGTNKVLFNNVEFDSLSQWDATDQRFFANWPGLYRFSGEINFVLPPAQSIQMAIYKNGSIARLCFQNPQLSDINLTYPFSSILSLSIADYVDLYLTLDSITNIGVLSSAQFEYLGNG
jgi:hypothetical protein